MTDEPGDDGDVFNDAISVSRGLIRDVFQASTAAAKLDQAERNGLKVGVRDRADLRSDVQQATVRLRFEIEQAADRGEPWASDILERWDAGLLHRLEQRQMRGGDYAALARDISTAGIELGYTNVRYGEDDADDSGHSPDDGEILELIESME